MRSVDEKAAAIYEAAQLIEADGNGGIYAGHFPESCSWILLSQYKPDRDGILFYSSGHGWRVRRKPYNWREIFSERFPTFKPEVHYAKKESE